MEIQQVLHMNGGDGKTSYAINSQLQVSPLSMSILMLFCSFLSYIYINLICLFKIVENCGSYG